MRTLYALPLFVLMACAGCVGTKPVIPPTPDDAKVEILRRRIAWYRDTIPLVQFAIPNIYGAWRLEVERCSGKTKDGWPTFYMAPIAPLASDGRVAFYAPDSKSIVIALGQVGEGWLVKHELLHWLLDPHPGDEGHPVEFFGDVNDFGKCGHLVRPQS